MFNRFQQGKTVGNGKEVERVEENIGRLENLANNLSKRFPAPQRDSEEDEAIPFGSAPQGKKAFPAPTTRPIKAPMHHPEPARAEPSRQRPVVTQQPQAVPAPTEPEPKRRAEPPTDFFMEERAPRTGRVWRTLRFAIDSAQIGFCSTAFGTIMSPKVFGLIKGAEILVALTGSALWTPGVLLGLFCFQLYAYYSEHPRLSRWSWHLLFWFVVIKALRIAFFGGSW